MQITDGVPATAGCLDGHFPGNPIVPGAVLLGYAAKTLQVEGIGIASVLRMKFQRPLSPDTPFEIEMKRDGANASLVWQSEETVLAQARVTLRDHGG